MFVKLSCYISFIFMSVAAYVTNSYIQKTRMGVQ